MSEYEMKCEGCNTQVTIEIEGYLGSLDDYWCEDCGFDGENMENTLFTIDEIRKHYSDGLTKSEYDYYHGIFKVSLEMYDYSERYIQQGLVKAMSVMLLQSGYSPEASS